MAIEANDKLSIVKRQAQRVLAEAVTRFVHGEEGLAAAQRISQALFNGKVATLTRELIEQGAVRLNGEPAHSGRLGDSFALVDTYWVVQKGKNPSACLSCGYSV